MIFRKNQFGELMREKFSEFFRAVNDDFSPPLSKQVENFDRYIEKMYSYGTVAFAMDCENNMIAAVVGYTDNTPNDMSYITQVCVKEAY